MASCRPHDTIARVGGDEFALLLDQLGGPDDVVPVAERIIRFVSEEINAGDVKLTTNASIGVAMVAVGDKPDDVLRRADEAMYAAKDAGKGQFQIYSDGTETLTSVTR